METILVNSFINLCHTENKIRLKRRRRISYQNINILLVKCWKKRFPRPHHTSSSHIVNKSRKRYSNNICEKKIGDYLISHSQSLSYAPLVRSPYYFVVIWIGEQLLLMMLLLLLLCYTQETAAVQHIFLAFPTPDSLSVCACVRVCQIK